MANGTWSINPTTGITRTGLTSSGDLEIVFDKRTTSAQDYIVQYKEGNYCGQIKVTQEGTTPPQPPTGTCEEGHSPCVDCMGPINETFIVENKSGHAVTIFNSVKIKMAKSGTPCDYYANLDYEYINGTSSDPMIEIGNNEKGTIPSNILKFTHDSTVARWCTEEGVVCLGKETSFFDGTEIVCDGNYGVWVYYKDGTGYHSYDCSIARIDPVTQEVIDNKFYAGSTFKVTIP